MLANNLKQKDLLDVFGTPSIASEVLSGKRELNAQHIRRLSRRFKVSSLQMFFSGTWYGGPKMYAAFFAKGTGIPPERFPIL